ncbi:hypothetical protein [Streptomyces drozdowiczii]|uniref:DUF4034 domain-containing protein n=1 Tax=Streptomyces drozdowiczii TaxID=202862 RepID=A0ABY6PKW1_9ACTN|nr:hypothetical protein [Streptomyces drozdowiczii]MCX0247815.1 hypothetical protein [Streptomyces drozdowiczii]UZK52825.1 hypothetical protein NEH16_00700 [Streptomyces drozdowiczii]
MFGKLFGRAEERTAAGPHALPAPHKQNGMYTLRALGDTRVLALVGAARLGDWEAVKAALAPFDLGRDHQILNELEELGRLQTWIGRAVEEDKEHRATALLISGARHIQWGWEARTAARASQVTEQQWRVFHKRLRIGEEQLLEAAELRPEWVTPWRRLLTSGRGMSLGPDITEARRDAALRRAPLDLETHIEWISQLQPRWGGEPGQALRFARDTYADAPEGDRIGCVIPMAHIEDWVESDETGCLKTDEIREELRRAAEHSILHPGYERRPGWQHDFNIFAMALSLAGERQTAKRVFRALDGAFTSWPWAYFGDPEKQFARHQRRA